MTCDCAHSHLVHALHGCTRCPCRVTELQLESARRHTPACTVTADVSSGFGVARCTGEHRLIVAHRDRSTGAWFAPPQEPVADPGHADTISLVCDTVGCTRMWGHGGDHRIRGGAA